MTLPLRVRIPDGVMARQVADELVILDLTSGNYFGLDAVGARIWHFLAAGKTPAEACEAMLGEYEVDRDRLEGDLERLLRELGGKGLITLS
jgi:hypothetical protein